MAPLVRITSIAVALWVATLIVPGHRGHGARRPRPDRHPRRGRADLRVVNAVVKPVMKLLGCAFYILTLGLIGLVVNALLFLLVG